jgi:hypothetical protein
LSEKAAFEARNQAEKSTAERLSSISKANGMNSRASVFTYIFLAPFVIHKSILHGKLTVVEFLAG